MFDRSWIDPMMSPAIAAIMPGILHARRGRRRAYPPPIGPRRSRVVTIPPDHTASFSTVADRIYYSTAPVDRDGDITGPRTYASVGPCGESPRPLAHKLPSALPLARWPDIGFACIPDIGVVILDPDAVQPPHVVIPTIQPTCQLYWTPHGILDAESDGDGGTNILLRSPPDDPRRDTATSQVLLTLAEFDDLDFAQSAVHYLSPEHTLMRLDIVTRAVTPVQDNVYSYQTSADERYLLWQARIGSEDAPGRPTGALSLRDNLTGTSVALGDATDGISAFYLGATDRGVLYTTSGPGGRFYFLPDLTIFDLPAGTFASRALVDGRWLLESGDAPWLRLLDLDDRTITPLFGKPAEILGVEADSVLLLAVEPWTYGPLFSEEAPVWRVPLDGSPAQKLAERATRYSATPIDETRMLVGVDSTEDPRRTLLLVDTTTRAEQIIDHDVTYWSRPKDDPTLLTYRVDNGDRSGLWRVRLPPAP